MAKNDFFSSSAFPIVVLGGAGIYFLYKGGFFEGVGQVGKGLGTGVQGLGEGISSAASGIGTGTGQIGLAAGSIATGASDFLSPFGSIGRAASSEIELTSDLAKNKALRGEDVEQSGFSVAKPTLIGISATSQITQASEGLKRTTLTEQAKTGIVSYFTSSLPAAAREVLSAPIVAAKSIISGGKALVSNINLAANKVPEPAAVLKSAASSVLSGAKSLYSSISKALKR